MVSGVTGSGKTKLMKALMRWSACAVKAFSPQWVQVAPGNWFVPPGSNRSSGGCNKAAEASGRRGS